MRETARVGTRGWVNKRPLSAAGFVLVFLAQPLLAGEMQSFPLRGNGTIPVWTIAGPFPNGKPLMHGPGCFGFFKDFLDSAGGEMRISPSEGDRVPCEERDPIVWRTALSNPDGLLDFIDLFDFDRETPGVAYAFCILSCSTAREAVFKVRSNDGVRVWLNGELVHENHIGRSLDEGGEDRVPVRLREGDNRLLVKVDQGGGDWGNRLAVEVREDTLPRELQVRVSAALTLRGRLLAASFASTCLVKKTPEGPRQIVAAEISSGGLCGVVCRIEKKEWSGQEAYSLGDLEVGLHRIELPIPVVGEEGPARIVLESTTDRTVYDEISLSKPREWTLYLVQHTHHDIGYTRAQDEILPDFLRYLDSALDYCDRTDDFPEDAKFRWTCEISWVMREFLKRRPPEQIERLRKRVAEGRIEIAGLFLNLDEIADENLLAASLQPIREFRDQGFPVATAMQNDVPGAAWCWVDYLSEIDVPYLIMGINNDRTPRPFDRPTAFWWESPAGKRVLAWRPDHYHTGNHLRIHQGNRDALKKKTLQYLQQMERTGYPFDRIAAQYSGMQIDNSPPAMSECETIREWNETYHWPHLRSATAREFMDFVAEAHAAELPVYRGAWPNWWTDGFAFAHFETARARKAHADFSVTEGLLSMASLLGSQPAASVASERGSLEDNLLFYDEHTYGAQETFSQPMAENTVIQWGEKVSTVWDALPRLGMLRETAWGLLQPHFAREAVPTITVTNTLAWQRSGPVEVYIGHELLPLGKVFRILDIQTGEEVPAEVARSRFEGSYWNLWVRDVPAMGWKTLRIEVEDRNKASEEATRSEEFRLENEDYRLEVDPKTGALSSLFDKELKRELVDGSAEFGFGQFVYDRLSDAHFYDRESYLARSTRSTLTNVRIEKNGDSPLWKSLSISADAEGCISTPGNPGFECEVRLIAGEKEVEFHYTLRKAYVDRPESVYIAFPFNSPGGQIAYEAQGGVVRPGIDQIPGSSSDWHTFQNFVTVRDAEGQFILASDEIPLVQFGDINLGKWQKVAQVEKPFVFSWVMNNYWTSGFRGSKESVFRWSYHLTSTRDTSSAAAARFGWKSRTPFAARVHTGASEVQGQPIGSTLRVGPPNVLVVNSSPNSQGGKIGLHLREVEGSKTRVEIDTGDLLPGIEITDVLGGARNRKTDELWLEPYETVFVTLSF